MKTQLVTALAVGLLFGAGASRADDQAQAKALLDKAIKAMNGEAKLAKLGTASLKTKITSKAGNEEIALGVDGTWQGMSQYRADVDVQVGARNFKGVMVVNGAKGWLKRMERTEEAPAGLAEFIQNLFHAARMPVLLPALADKAYTPTILAEVKVGDRPALGVLFSHKERKDVSLYFDKESGLLLKSEVRLADPQGKEITIECVFRDYKDFDGVKLCAKIGIKLDDQDFTAELTEIKPVEKVDASQFEKP
jgi:hypothetical protein